MLIHYLERRAEDHLTRGKLYTPDGSYETLECPWRNNEPYISCIPDGAYKLTPWVSPRHGPCYILEGEGVGHTKGIRTLILIHKANWVHELLGCIALGTAWSGDTLLNSKVAFDAFMKYMNGREAMLFISTPGRDEQ